MKNSLIVILLGICAMGTAFAQENANAASKASQWTAKMNEWLSLPADKQSRLTAINEKALKDAGDALAPIKGNESATPEAKKAAFKTASQAMKGREKAIKELLSEDEWKRYEAHQLENKAMIQTQMLGRQIDLSPEQETELDKVHLDLFKKMPDIPEREDLEKMGKMEKMQMAKKMKAINQEKEKAYTRILTKEQMDSYEKFKEERNEAMKARRGKS